MKSEVPFEVGSVCREFGHRISTVFDLLYKSLTVFKSYESNHVTSKPSYTLHGFGSAAAQCVSDLNPCLKRPMSICRLLLIISKRFSEWYLSVNVSMFTKPAKIQMLSRLNYKQQYVFFFFSGLCVRHKAAYCVAAVNMRATDWSGTNQLFKGVTGLKSPIVCVQKTHGISSTVFWVRNTNS